MSELTMTRRAADFAGALRPAVNARQFGKEIIAGVASSVAALALQVGAPAAFANPAVSFTRVMEPAMAPVGLKPTLTNAPVSNISAKRATTLVKRPSFPTPGPM